MLAPILVGIVVGTLRIGLLLVVPVPGATVERDTARGRVDEVGQDAFEEGDEAGEESGEDGVERVVEVGVEVVAVAFVSCGRWHGRRAHMYESMVTFPSSATVKSVGNHCECFDQASPSYCFSLSPTLSITVPSFRVVWP
mgnify:FL=1